MTDTTTEDTPIDFDELCAAVKKFFLGHKVIDSGTDRWWMSLSEAARFVVEEQVTTIQQAREYFLILIDRFPDWKGDEEMFYYAYNKQLGWIKLVGEFVSSFVQLELNSDVQVKAEVIRRTTRNETGGYAKELARSQKVYHYNRTASLAS